ncbi:glycosyltransferase family 4 protein [Arthrobacter sp. CC3]|uniref:glycosyltransferase family 4 protein n=1 Tax=Arthrobacter sp. CC3 TaxID=3029185 RepID=UPI003265E6FB
MLNTRRFRAPLKSVFHCGPAVRETGGISTVIDELTSIPNGSLRHIPMATWSSSDRDYGLVRALRALLLLVKKRITDGPFWVHLHVSERGSFIREGMVGHFMSLLGCGLAVTIHGADFVHDHGDWSSTAARRLLKRADVVFSLGPVSASIVKGIAPDTGSVTLANPLNPPMDSDVSVMAQRPTTVIFGGELSQRKGFDLLKAAWPLVTNKVPGATCQVFGPLSDVEVQNLPGGMTYLGNASRHELLAAVASAKIACLPSRREVLPMFVLESMARGLAIVTTSVGELGQLGEEQGVTRVDHDPDEIADAICALAEDPHRTAAFGQRSREWVMENATTRHVIRTMEVAYKAAEGVA